MINRINKLIEIKEKELLKYYRRYKNLSNRQDLFTDLYLDMTVRKIVELENNIKEWEQKREALKDD